MMIVNPGLSTQKVLKFYYDAEGRPMCLDFNGTVYYYITNLQGDVVALADQYGEVIRYEYDAWGKPISTYYVASPYYDAMQYNPLRYRGYIYDNETGFYYLQSRYYDPVVGRFINSDGQLNSGFFGNNMFAYCENNPVNMADNTGEIPFFVITAAVGAVIGAVAGGILAAQTGGNVWAGIGLGAAAGALIGTGAGMAAGAALAGSITATTGAVVAGGGTLVSTVATGGVGAGATYVANNLQQAGNELSNAIAISTPKIISKTPANPGNPFEAGKTGIQYGVNPNTLIPQKDLTTLDPQRMANAVKFGGDHAVRVGLTGIIQDGHHRVADAIMNGRAVDVFVEPYK